MLRRVTALVALFIASATAPPATSTAQRGAREPLLVAAAASLSGVAPELAAAFAQEHGLEVRFNFGGSNTLARQIVEGAPIDVFLSADPVQMDVVERAGRIVKTTRVDLLGNMLKVIRTSLRGRDLPSGFKPSDLADPSVRRIAMGDPSAVPVGRYGKEWLEMVGLWNQVAHKVIPLPSSPAVVAAVREGRADVGIVYTTDDAKTGGAYIVPLAESPRIVYPAAVVSHRRHDDAQAFLTFLQKSTARKVFTDAGFVVLH